MNLPLLLAAHWQLVSYTAGIALAGLVIVLACVGWDAYMEERM